MDVNEQRHALSEVQAAIHRVFLSLKSLLLNGIQYAVIHQEVFTGFLEKAASDLLAELMKLEACAGLAPIARHAKVRQLIAELVSKSEALIQVVSGLASFRTIPVHQLHSAVSQVRILWEEAGRLIGGLETCLQEPEQLPGKSGSDAAFNDFLANLEKILQEEKAASNISAG